MAILTAFADKITSERLGLTFDIVIVHCGLVVQKEGETRNITDKWLFTLSRGSVSESFEFWTGIGHRKPAKAYNEDQKYFIKKAMKICTGAELKQSDDNYALAKENVDMYTLPVRPKLDDLLYSLVLDADACDNSFEEWCSNLGYDSDSRKAFATYEACKANGKKLIGLGVDIAAAQEKFQDY